MNAEMRKMVEYLSDNFANPECRKELYKLIHEFLKNKK